MISTQVTQANNTHPRLQSVKLKLPHPRFNNTFLFLQCFTRAAKQLSLTQACDAYAYLRFLRFLCFAGMYATPTREANFLGSNDKGLTDLTRSVVSQCHRFTFPLCKSARTMGFHGTPSRRRRRRRIRINRRRRRRIMIRKRINIRIKRRRRRRIRRMSCLS